MCRKPNQYALYFNEQITKTRLFLLQLSIRPVSAQVVCCGKGRQNFASNVTLYSCERSRQNRLARSHYRRKTAKNYQRQQVKCLLYGWDQLSNRLPRPYSLTLYMRKNQVILAGTLTRVQGDVQCKVLVALTTVK